MRLSPDAMIGAAVTFVVGLISAYATWRVGHRQGKASFVTAVHEAAHLVITDLQKDREDLREERQQLRLECERLQGLCDENRDQHEACRGELAKACAEIVEMKDQAAEMRAQISQLMAASPAAVYQVKPQA